MRVKQISILLFSLIIIAACGKSNEEEILPLKVAKAYGFDNFEKVNSIAYTWNVQVDSVRIVSRNWKWNIKESSVFYADSDTSFSYSLGLPKDQKPQIDKGFINDKYWLMFPFQLVWDSGYSYEVEENVPAPISGTPSTKMIVVYNNEDGYTPGDAYDLYLDDNFFIKEWVFRRGNGPEGRAITWESEKEFKGIKLATEHRNDKGALFIWFTNLEVN
ncbi:hypothetical protein [Cecembia rubra]|uniref:Uncharacterized protein n=1 Tax=Cecembia rubra TaxID=1485585 RepID=A0A2P8DXR6_9BACT|nr:hypothetical protein [Cecembia rubra]PSL02019.1 hypothetical protein CLV48_111108 [Cecembia rubra]